MAITDQVAVQNYMLIDIDAGFVSQINDWIQAIGEYMDKATNRQLIADETAADYKYDGTGKKSIVIDDFVTITKVMDGSNIITTSCFLYPANSTPKWRMEADSRIFTKGRQNIVVTGRRGAYDEDTLPEALKFTATVLLAGIINYAYDDSTGDVQSETIGRYSVTYANTKQREDFAAAMQSLKQYRRPV